MGDLETSTGTVNLRESLDFIVQQGLTLLGGIKAYDDLLAHWAELPAKQKQARDAGGAAPFWSAQKERFVDWAAQIKNWPDFGEAKALKASVKKDSLLWFGKEALTDSNVKLQERQAAIRKAYQAEYKTQQKHESLFQKEEPTAKRPRTAFQSLSLPQAPKPSTAFTASSIPPTLSTTRSAFQFSAGPPKPKNRFASRKPFHSKRPIKCNTCHKWGHMAKDCRPT